MNKFTLTATQLQLVNNRVERLEDGLTNGVVRFLKHFGRWGATLCEDVENPLVKNPYGKPSVDKHAFALLSLTLNREDKVVLELDSLSGAELNQSIKVPLSLVKQGIREMNQITRTAKNDSLYKRVSTQGNWVIRVPDYKLRSTEPGVSIHPAMLEPCLDLTFTLDPYTDALLCTLDYNGMGA